MTTDGGAPRARGYGAGPRARLESELRRPLPAGLAALGADELDHLAQAVTRARRNQAAELAAAGERGLRFVPRLVRGPLKKVLG